MFGNWKGVIMWQLVYESRALQEKLIFLFVESCKNNKNDFNRFYKVIKRNEKRWNRRFNKAMEA